MASDGGNDLPRPWLIGCEGMSYAWACDVEFWRSSIKASANPGNTKPGYVGEGSLLVIAEGDHQADVLRTADALLTPAHRRPERAAAVLGLTYPVLAGKGLCPAVGRRMR